MLVIFTSNALARFGARRFVLFGVASLAVAIALLAFAREPWQVYAAYLTMSFGWLGLGLVTIPTLISQWFTRKRGLAISLALNGASFGGIVVAPLLVLLIGATGFQTAMLIAAAVMVVDPGAGGPAVGADARRDARAGRSAEPAWTRRDALRSLPFWTVSGPFSLALLAQVAFIVHQIAFMEPMVGRAQAALSVSVMTVMAVTGRLTLGAVVDRLDPRLISSVSMFSQAVALFCMTRTTRPDAAARLLRGLWLLGRQHHHAALADHAARVPARDLRHGAGPLDRDRHLRGRARSRPDRPDPRRGGRLCGRAAALHGAEDRGRRLRAGSRKS